MPGERTTCRTHAPWLAHGALSKKVHTLSKNAALNADLSCVVVSRHLPVVPAFGAELPADTVRAAMMLWQKSHYASLVAVQVGLLQCWPPHGIIAAQPCTA